MNEWISSKHTEEILAFLDYCLKRKEFFLGTKNPKFARNGLFSSFHSMNIMYTM